MGVEFHYYLATVEVASFDEVVSYIVDFVTLVFVGVGFGLRKNQSLPCRRNHRQTRDLVVPHFLIRGALLLEELVGIVEEMGPAVEMMWGIADFDLVEEVVVA